MTEEATVQQIENVVRDIREILRDRYRHLSDVGLWAEEIKAGRVPLMEVTLPDVLRLFQHMRDDLEDATQLHPNWLKTKEGESSPDSVRRRT